MNEDSIDFGAINLQPTLSLLGEKDFEESQSATANLQIFLLHSDVEVPSYATSGSACFDICAYLGNDIEKVSSYNSLLIHTKKRVFYSSEINSRAVYIEPKECLYIPTGFILDIPERYKVVIYPRSGASSQRHLKLANCVAIIDSDFVNEVMLLMQNQSDKRLIIGHGSKLAQGEIVPVTRALFEILDVPPERKTERNGGFGHTGK